MFTALTIAAGLLALVLVSTAAVWSNAPGSVPDVAVAATVYAASRHTLSGALMTALVVGWFSASLTGDLRGAYLLSLLPVVAGTRAVAQRLALSGVWAGAGWCVLSVLVSSATFALLAAITGAGLNAGSTLIRVVPQVALATGALALALFGMLQLVEPLLRERQARSTLLR